MNQGVRGLFPKAWASALEERVHMDSPQAGAVLAEGLYQFGLQHLAMADELVLVCIGSDRSIGDALGPLVGTYVSESIGSRFPVLGTLDNPVHASNLASTLEWLDSTYTNPLVIAVDACLGRMESVGMLTVGRGSLKPGAGVNKALPAVGKVYVTGVVNVGGFMEYFVLQNTRLSLVVRMAKVLADGVSRGLGALNEARMAACTTGPGQ